MLATRAALATIGAIGLTACGQISDRQSWWQGHALDGDTFTVGSNHYRVASIDAPELPGHCRGYRLAHNTCAPGDPYAAKRALQWFLDRGLFCNELGPDYYGRTLVSCRTRDWRDLGDEMINLGYAVPYRRYQ